MINRLVCLIVSFVVSQSAYAAGAPCLSYETFKHPTLPPVALNQALVNYNYATIQANNNALIPALAVGAHQLGISLMRQGLLPVIAWQTAIIPPAGAPWAVLTLQEACLMAIARQSIGITIKFQQPAFAIIMLISAGTPIAGAGGVAALLGIPPANVIAIVNNALQRGGYLTPLATTLYRLRNSVPVPNFAILGAPGPGVPIADCVMIHIHDPRRVSKNVKELSFNAIPNPALPGMAPYLSIKDMIDAQFIPPFAPPHSATVVSSDFLQLN